MMLNQIAYLPARMSSKVRDFGICIGTATLLILGAAIGRVLDLIQFDDLAPFIGEAGAAWVEAHPLLAVLGLFLVALLVGGVVNVLRDRQVAAKTTAQADDLRFTPEVRRNLLHHVKGRNKVRLDDMLDHEAEIELGLETDRSALQLSPQLRLVGPARRSEPRGTSIYEVFTDKGEQLLILGAPGAGKTTLMLKLAQALVNRALNDRTEPVPVVVNLESWAAHRGPIDEWLPEALRDQEIVADAELGAELATSDRLLFLFDGLDEVEAQRRAACVQALNEFAGGRGTRRMAVCSRAVEYEEIGERLSLLQAVRLQPLSPEEIIEALEGVPRTDGLRQRLREDELLRELATTPLMMSVMLLAYEGEVPESAAASSLSERRDALWDDYTARMIARRPTEYEAGDILRWLRWLAGKMQQADLASFIPDRMQPDWLDNPVWFRRSVKGLFGLAYATTGLVVFGPRAPILLASGVGLLSGFLIGIAEDVEDIELQEQARWSWEMFRTDWKGSLKEGLITGVIGGAVVALLIGSITNLKVGILAGLAIAAGTTFHVAVLEPARFISPVETVRKPGDRVRFSWRNGVLYSVFFIFFISLFGFLFLFNYLSLNPIYFLLSYISVFTTLLITIEGSGEATKFNLLRLFLWREGAIPWRYFRFLRRASDLLLLQTVGGTVRFRHLLLQDYFAGLTDERIESLARKINGSSTT
jgi:energy-coupling factor transporter ATP-binding protein EcfA2